MRNGTHGSDQRHLAARYLDLWDDALVTWSGVAQAKEREALIRQAVEVLGGGATLGAFIEGLHERRETETVDRLL